MIDPEVQARNKKTAAYLKKIATDPEIRKISHLTLPQIDHVISEIVSFLPGDDLPTFILRGLTASPDGYVPIHQVEEDTALLNSAWQRIKRVALFGTFFAGPAAVMIVYQKLLLLAGKTADLAFPEGQWQFYVDYALREDKARHTHETTGFDRVLTQHAINLTQIDRLTAWVMAAVEMIFEYPIILRNEWRERVYLKTLVDVVDPDHELADRVRAAARSWTQNRPYRRGSDVLPGESYPLYRQRIFDDFIAVYLGQLDEHQRRRWLNQAQQYKERDLPDFQKQMSIQATLKPGKYVDERSPLDRSSCLIGVIFRGQYFFIPVTRPQTSERPDVTMVRSQIAAIVNERFRSRPLDLKFLARCPRKHLQPLLEARADANFSKWDAFQRMPILINGDRQSSALPLAQIRQGERGIGTHPVTLFDTDSTAVFDLSHIFFDGLWGAAFSEMMTSSATAWAIYLHTLPPIHPPVSNPLHLEVKTELDQWRSRLASDHQEEEAGAETDQIHLRNLLALRRVFKLRNDLIRLTVNDVLVLYRSIHAFTYTPDAALVRQLEELTTQPATAAAARAALSDFDLKNRVNPSMLIPVDGSRNNPRDRVFPLCFQIPIREMGLVELHREVMAALDIYHQEDHDRGDMYERFDQLQRHYLSLLAGLGAVFAEAKQAAARGETISVKTINLLAHLPRPLQHLLDHIPDHIELINHLVKGQEVFSNIGVVSSASSLRRFLSAKDDNPGKTMAWGVLTDAQLTMRLTLRDFRPSTRLLLAAGEHQLAHALTADYLLGYTQGLNQFVNDLRRITMASRETRLAPGPRLVNVPSL